tara:strand:- start:579 stop:992 length:414 start_codon:yes stop_codon:yes gene_type:complete
MLNHIDLQKLFQRDDLKKLVTSYRDIDSIIDGACGPVSLFLSYRLHLLGIKSFISSFEIEPNSHTICIVDKIVVDCACNYLIMNVGSASNIPYEFVELIPNLSSKYHLKNRNLYWQKNNKLKLKNPLVIKEIEWVRL